MHDIHIYENQIAMMKEQLRRIPYELPKLCINPDIRTLKDLETWVTTDDFEIYSYRHHEKINYPFAV
jgi:thymidylate synthase